MRVTPLMSPSFPHTPSSFPRRREPRENKARHLPPSTAVKGSFWEAPRVERNKDRRGWALFVIYGACFGVKLTINNIASPRHSRGGGNPEKNKARRQSPTTASN